MKKYIQLLVAGGLLMAGAQKAQAQDIHFSQFYENAILRNPALTGIFSGDYKFGANYRTQWSNISVPFQTMLVSAETRVATNREVGDYLSFGVSATYDKAGTINFNSLKVYPAINYNKAMEDQHNSYLSVGFAGGFIQRSFDMSKATFASQFSTSAGYDPLTASGENITNTVMQAYDLGAGISLNSSIGPANNVNYYLGLAGYHLNKPKQSFQNYGELVNLSTKVIANMGLKANFTDQYALTMHFNYTVQGQYRELMAGGLASWRTNPEMNTSFAVYGGVFIRYKDAIIPTFKLDYNQYSLTLSYDVNTSSLRPASNGLGGFELSLFVRGNYAHASQYGAQMSCPRFEQMLQSTLQSF